MDAQLLAIILLSLRIIAVGLLLAVIIKQIMQIRTTVTNFPAVRGAILVLTIVLLLGQILPIVLDSVVAFGSTYAGRNISPTSLNAGYSLSNATKDVVIGALLAFLYFRRTKKL